uniref:Uncharacterized protein n=1 Tax=Anguilla anguilla TaxID=7936 RepID=A0A0E9UL77_ANGAN
MPLNACPASQHGMVSGISSVKECPRLFSAMLSLNTCLIGVEH